MKINLCFFLHPQGERAIFSKPLEIRVIRVRQQTDPWFQLLFLGVSLCDPFPERFLIFSLRKDQGRKKRFVFLEICVSSEVNEIQRIVSISKPF